jgi:PKD repeat protein
MSLRKLLGLATMALAASWPAHGVAADDTGARRVHPPKADFPSLRVADRVTQGQAAIDELGARLPEVARWYRKSDDEFRQLLLKDARLRIDRRGRLYVEDQLDAPLAAGLAADEQSVLDGTLLPVDQTFVLHSRPGARRTIYLNFKGATLSGTAWNSGGGSLTALPFDLDGIPYSFSTTELQRIQGIWQRVAEDYAPFDVDVTTEAPSADTLTRSSGSDQVFGTTVLITKTTGVYSCNCGGVAYVGVFDEVGNTYKPALVFYDKLGPGSEKYVAEAVSHEAGHNMGLQHDGYSGGSYYGGHGSGVTGWAPIMGVGYSRNLVQWSKGEYASANNTQDDYTAMAQNGLPLRDDDHGNTVATATPMAASSAGGVNLYDAQGVIERPSDVDMFSFTAGAGTVTVSLSPAARAPNLDALIELRSTSGTLLASANPADALNAGLSVLLPSAGTYVVSVQGVGKGDPLGTGYSDYGSLGNYALQVTTLAASGQAPVAVISATPVSGTVPLTVNFSAAGSTDADGSIVSYAWSFGDGSSASGVTASHVYNSAGSFTATLTVTDNSGLSASRSVTVTVQPVVAVQALHVADIAMSLSASGRNRARAVADVQVLDALGRPVVGATVSGRWSGLVSGSVSGTTGSSGIVRFSSATTRASGTFTFTVNDVQSSGYRYDSASNSERSDSITR